jgi:uncharacterized membrane protein
MNITEAHRRLRPAIVYLQKKQEERDQRAQRDQQHATLALVVALLGGVGLFIYILRGF